MVLKFMGFEISQNPNKKYDALVLNKATGKVKRIAFGDRAYQHFKDKALGVYSHLDHNDPQRRSLYKKRHAGEDKNKYSAGYFAWKYLW